ncbi:ExeM/NucH family extracellular endonuclease [Pontivivens ytuae]|uniref:ExeM/NucH family extracellular endonuclease n=1 Tax=Pontivivens ytuae TaxID=2789856 RepID=A0A7S9QBI3_9RHOB|nr:ExeM/NucH family extracellular endonuclease [Pontivivens ytuae]QPH52913.1 ExeM/NucH family extracellular endonuclease [Pontivivens ytuae]
MSQTILGTSDDDTLIGTAAAEFLIGLDGNDLISGGLGLDTMDGGAGIDTVDFSYTGADIRIDLSASQAVFVNGAVEGIFNFENATGGRGDDTLVGDRGDNILNGGRGDDLLIGGFGVDTFDGGGGNDTLSFDYGGIAVDVDLSTGQAVFANGVVETFTSIENVIGNDRANALTGDAGANVLEGLQGDDTLVGNAGEDTLRGGSGDDVLEGGADDDVLAGSSGDDTLEGGDGSDLLFGGDGVDVAVYAGSIEDYLISDLDDAPVVIVATGDAPESGRDELRDIEVVRFEEDGFTLFLDGRNNAPITTEDEIAVFAGQPQAIDFAELLANDRDFDGDPLTITSVTPRSENGAILTLLDGQIIYDGRNVDNDLSIGEKAFDTFSYTVDDGNGGTAQGDVNVTITPFQLPGRIEVDGSITFDEESEEFRDNLPLLRVVGDGPTDDATISFFGVDLDRFIVTPDPSEPGGVAIRWAFRPDFETPQDVGGDNIYDITVQIEDSSGVRRVPVRINVEDVDEGFNFNTRINEIHYDNDGTDVGEFVEVRVAETDEGAENLTLYYYNGSNGEVYLTTGIGPRGSSDDEFSYNFIELPTNGLQNGSPDGVALVNDRGQVLDFISYEGSFVAVDGPAAGLRSLDIGVSEDGDTPVGASLARADDGSWFVDDVDSRGFANDQEVPTVMPRINEVHYDNAGTDAGEFIEIRLDRFAVAEDITVELVNGANGEVYDTVTGFEADIGVPGKFIRFDEDFQYLVFEFDTNGIQNGPDGFILREEGEVVEFLSYEGEITATIDGVELTSTDIGVAEGSSTPEGFSLQRSEDGSWSEAAPETRGAANETITSSANARINEFHYDNDGGDVGEFIEVRVDAGADISGLLLELINGNGGGVYDTLGEADVTARETDGTFDYLVFELPSNGIQNGPDGFALSENGELVEFVSYEGEITATEGVAAGQTSTDVRVSEGSSTPIGFSIQRNDDGTWNAPAEETPGAANDAGSGGGGGGGEPAELLISEIQGTEDVSARLGEVVSVTAVVTYVLENGFLLQEEDADSDGNDATSEGILVLSNDVIDARVGDNLTVVGEVVEEFGETAITNIDVRASSTNSTGNTLPGAAQIALDPTIAYDFEAFEGMRVEVSSGTDDALTVIENFNLDRFGQITVSAGEQRQPTQLFDAQTEQDEIDALQQANLNNRLLIDDGFSSQNPDEFEFIPVPDAFDNADNPNGFLDVGDTFNEAGATLRLGTELSENIEGVMRFGFGEYNVVPTEQLAIDESTNSGARPDAPVIEADVTVASFNVLNYFTTLDVPGNPGSGPNQIDPRGATSAADLEEQTAKLVEAILALDADVLGLQELENNGFDADSSIATLVDALNAVAGAGTYAFVEPAGTTDGFIGTDAITTGLIYKPEEVTVTNAEILVFEEASAATTFDLADVLNQVVPESEQVGDFQRSRPAVVATFEDNESGEEFTVAVNHFKSKGDSNLQDVVDAAQQFLDGGGTGITQADIDAVIADPNFDQEDGQAFWNAARNDAAGELATFLETEYNGGGVSDYLVIGDLNAYSQEDPVQTIRDTDDNVDLLAEFVGIEEAYSFVFDGQQGALDHAIASGDLADNVVDVAEWHSQADEPDLIDYDSEFTNPGFSSTGPFAASDHDPLLIGLDFSDTPLV